MTRKLAQILSANLVHGMGNWTLRGARYRWPGGARASFRLLECFGYGCRTDNKKL